MGSTIDILLDNHNHYILLAGDWFREVSKRGAHGDRNMSSVTEELLILLNFSELKCHHQWPHLLNSAVQVT